MIWVKLKKDSLNNFSLPLSKDNNNKHKLVSIFGPDYI